MDHKLHDQMQSILDEIRNLLSESKSKEDLLLTTEEAAAFLNISKSALYKLTAQRMIPFSSPTGKRNYFRRSELRAFMEQNKVEPLDTNINL